MRPPSYYTSLANSNAAAHNASSLSIGYGVSSISRTPSQHLRHSRSTASLSPTPTSSSYSSSSLRSSHLPFASQSIVAASNLAAAAGDYAPGISYSSSRYSSPAHSSTAMRVPSVYVSPVYHSSSSSSTSGGYKPSTSYTPRTYSPLTSSYTSSTRSSYRPSAYQPIRLRERPLLNQISRQLDKTTTTSSRSPSFRATNDEPTKKTTASSPPLLGEDTNSLTKTNSGDWTNDHTRNISRNKYLIKFREIDKRSARPVSPLIDDVVVVEQSKQVEDKADSDCSIQVNVRLRQDAAEKPDLVPATQTSAEMTFTDNQIAEPIKKKESPKRVVKKKPAQSSDSKSKAPDVLKDIKTNAADASPKDVAVAQHETKSVFEKNDQQQADVVRDAKATLKSETADSKCDTLNSTKIENGPTLKQVQVVEAPIANASDENDGVKPKPKVKKVMKLKIRAVKSPADDTSAPKIVKKKTSPKSTPDSPSDPTKPKLVKTKRSTAKSQEDAKCENAAETLVGKENEPQKKSASAPATASTPTSAGGTKRIRFREYKFDDFNFISVLGHGGWGFVMLAELKQHDACFAVKCIKKITIVEDDDYDSIMIERKVLTLGNLHPFICKLFCTFETEGYLFFVMEYCAGGDLMFHVQREGKFTEPRCRFYAAEIICAIRFLHNQHIIYRDLKLDNILLDSAGHIRLVDFGMCQCRTYREEMLPSNFCGTPEYISPEIIKGVPYNHSVDWWSFGVLLYEMAVGKMPFRGNDENELLWNVCYEQIHYPMFLSKELTHLLQLLLEREPTKRMGMATCKAGDIYEQAWFKGVDWGAVEALKVQPAFVPEVSSNRDVRNFDADFTESAPELSPVDAPTLQRIDQSQFQKFPYTNPNVFFFDAPVASART